MVSPLVVYMLCGLIIFLILTEYLFTKMSLIEVDSHDIEYEVLINDRGRRYIKFTYDYDLNKKNYSSEHLIKFPRRSNLDDILESLEVKSFKNRHTKSIVTSPEIEKNKKIDVITFISIFLLMGGLYHILRFLSSVLNS